LVAKRGDVSSVLNVTVCSNEIREIYPLRLRFGASAPGITRH